MPEDSKLDEVGRSLREALVRMKDLEERIRRGDDVSEDEMTQIARLVAMNLQGAVDTMHEIVGPERRAEVEARMIAEMSDEEFEEWRRDYPIRQALGMARKLEKESVDA